MKSQLSAHKFLVQKCSNIEATAPPSSMYPRTPSTVVPDDARGTNTERLSVGMILEIPALHQFSCIATETTPLASHSKQFNPKTS